jgi:hypothetical protein
LSHAFLFAHIKFQLKQREIISSISFAASAYHISCWAISSSWAAALQLQGGEIQVWEVKRGILDPTVFFVLFRIAGEFSEPKGSADVFSSANSKAPNFDCTTFPIGLRFNAQS